MAPEEIKVVLIITTLVKSIGSLSNSNENCKKPISKTTTVHV